MFYSPRSNINFNSYDYSSFDSHRSRQEQQLLTRRQQERRLAEQEIFEQQQAQQDQELAYRFILAQKRREKEQKLQRQVEYKQRRLSAQKKARELAQQEVQLESENLNFSPFQFFQLPSPSQRSDQTSRAPVSIPIVSPVIPLDDSTDSNVDSPTDSFHQHYQTHLNRHRQLKTLSTLHNSLTNQKSNFKLPSTLSFQTPSTSSITSNQQDQDHKLAFDSINAPFLAYEDFLVGLLSKADAVESEGDFKIKESRKELVNRVELELKWLDEKKEESWKAQNQFDGNSSFDAPFSAASISTSVRPVISTSTESKETGSTLDSTSVLASVSPIPSVVLNDSNSVKVDNIHDSTPTSEMASDFGISTTNSTLYLDEITETKKESADHCCKLEQSESGDVDQKEFVLVE